MAQQFTDPTFAPDVLKKQRELESSQRYAEMLLKGGQDMPQGQMVSGHYVAPSITQYLSQALKSGLGGAAERGLPDKELALQRAKSQQLQDMFAPQQSMGQANPQALSAGLNGGAQTMPVGDVPGQMPQGQPQQGMPQEQQQSGMPLIPGTNRNTSMMMYQALGPDGYMKMLGQNSKPERSTSLAKNLAAAGLQPGSPEYQQAMMAAVNKPGTTVNVGQSEYGTIPPGWELATDPKSGARSMRPIAGGPVEQKQASIVEKNKGRHEATARAATTVVQDLKRGMDLLPELGGLASGDGVLGGITRTASAKIPGSIENRITQFTESALSNVGLDTLQNMRDNSPTGGALGQVPIQQQKRLEQVLGSLKIDQPPEVLKANIKRVMNIYTSIIHGTPEERARAVAQGKMTQARDDEINGFYYQLPFDERGNPIKPVEGAQSGNMGAMLSGMGQPSQNKDRPSLDSLLGF